MHSWVLYCLYLVKRSFYTANNIAYSALTGLVTKTLRNGYRWAPILYLLFQPVFWVSPDYWLWNGLEWRWWAAGWRMVAIVYVAVIGLVVNTISVFSVKELPEERIKWWKSIWSRWEIFPDWCREALVYKQVLCDDLCYLYFTTDLYTRYVKYVRVYCMTYILAMKMSSVARHLSRADINIPLIIAAGCIHRF